MLTHRPLLGKMGLSHNNCGRSSYPWGNTTDVNCGSTVLHIAVGLFQTLYNAAHNGTIIMLGGMVSYVAGRTTL